MGSCINEISQSNSSKENAMVQSENGLEEQKYQAYDFDTLLSGGYHLSYHLLLGKEKLQSLTLMKGNREIMRLGETSAGMRHKNLGYIGADLEDYFIFCQSFGSGNPTDIQIIEKKTGRIIRRGSWVDVDTNQLLVLYISEINQENEELKLFDLKNQKEITINGFNNCRCFEETLFGIRECVQIKSANKSEVVFSVEYKNEKIVKNYAR